MAAIKDWLENLPEAELAAVLETRAHETNPDRDAHIFAEAAQRIRRLAGAPTQ